MPDPSTKVSIILATYNEKEHIADLINDAYEKLHYDLEVIVVDDNSSDGTADIAQALEYPQLTVIRRKARGLASAFNRGIIESSGQILCWMDADMCMPIDVLSKMIDKLDDHDIAIGSRYAEGGSDNRAALRTLSSKFINGLARTVLGGNIGDYDSGFIAIRRSVLDSITIIPYGYGEYFIEMIYDAYRNGLSICEVGYAFRDRTVGVSKSAPSLWRFFSTGMQYVLRIFSLKFRSLFRGGGR